MSIACGYRGKGYAHNYHPACGCAGCSRQELEDERADELSLSLYRSPIVLCEAMGELTDEQLALMAGHLADDNDSAYAAIQRQALADYIASEIDRRTHETGATKLETVQHMLNVYEVPRTAPAQPWQVAA